MVCKPLLSGDQWVSVRPHEGVPDGDPWVIGVFVRDSEAPADLALLGDAVVRAGVKPAGWGLTIKTVTVEWGAIDALPNNWEGARATGNSWSTLDNAAW
jgi:hypothetical protein